MHANKNLFKQLMKKYALFNPLSVFIPSYNTPILILKDSSTKFYLLSQITRLKITGRIINEVIAKQQAMKKDNFSPAADYRGR